MPFFLHIADLHLVDDSASSEEVGDYKEAVISPVDRLLRQGQLQYTFQQFGSWFFEKHGALDAILITGDITDKSGKTGFAKLPELIKKVGPAWPTKDYGGVVVVPGNHDIKKRSASSSQDRYEDFLSATRNLGCITPVIEGIDIDANGQPLSASHDPSKHYLLDDDGRWVIVPINCADYYQSEVPLDKAIPQDQWDSFASTSWSDDDEVGKRYLRAVEKLRRRDIARVSRAQMNYWQTQFGLMTDDAKLVKIALLHHHLNQVTDIEEVSPYPDIVNLGAVRQFLFSNGISVVLHGHKHTSLTYWDYVSDLSKDFDGPAHKILVISGGTIDSQYNRGEDVARLLALNEPQRNEAHQSFQNLLGLAPTLTVTSIPTVPNGVMLPSQQLQSLRYRLYDDISQDFGPNSYIVLADKKASVVYARLLERILATETTSLNNIVCQISGPSSIQDLAEVFPKDESSYPINPADWLADVVNWWQCKDAHLWQIDSAAPQCGPFNHGERIHKFAGNIDQIERVINLLQKGSSTSKAIITLLNPATDVVNEANCTFPSFCLVQFHIRTASSKISFLDCVAFFRKQEMRHWWPINVTELYNLLNVVLGDIKHRNPRLELGTITTVTSVATINLGIPRAAVPALDRAVPLHRDRLEAMAIGLMEPVAIQNELADLWSQYLKDLTPPAERDEDGVPIALTGIAYIIQLLGPYERNSAKRVIQDIMDAMKSLLNHNNSFATTYRNGAEAKLTDYKEWRDREILLIKDLDRRVASRLADIKGSVENT